MVSDTEKLGDKIKYPCTDNKLIEEETKCLITPV